MVAHLRLHSWWSAHLLALFAGLHWINSLVQANRHCLLNARGKKNHPQWFRERTCGAVAGMLQWKSMRSYGLLERHDSANTTWSAAQRSARTFSACLRCGLPAQACSTLMLAIRVSFRRLLQHASANNASISGIRKRATPFVTEKYIRNVQ